VEKVFYSRFMVEKQVQKMAKMYFQRTHFFTQNLDKIAIFGQKLDKIADFRRAFFKFSCFFRI